MKISEGIWKMVKFNGKVILIMVILAFIVMAAYKKETTVNLGGCRNKVDTDTCSEIRALAGLSASSTLYVLERPCTTPSSTTRVVCVSDVSNQECINTNPAYINYLTCAGTGGTCTDSDGGDKPLVNGTVTYNSNTYPDFCDSGLLNEQFCTGGVLDGRFVNCATEFGSGWGCTSGKCVQGGTCTDSDGGINYNIKGTVTDLNGDPYDDICLTDSKTLRERSCNTDGTVTSQEYSCPQSCQNGACITSAICEDTDGGVIKNVKGDIKINGVITRTDSCDAQFINKVNEYSCSGDTYILQSLICDVGYSCVSGACVQGTCTTNGQIQNYRCSGIKSLWDKCVNNGWVTETQDCTDGCSGGKCVQGGTCTDSDGGKDYITSGTVIYGGTSYTDTCVYVSGNYGNRGVKEYYCLNGIKAEEIKDCPELFGMADCVDGQCVECKLHPESTDPSWECTEKYGNGYTCTSNNLCQQTGHTCSDYPNNYGTCLTGASHACSTDKTSILTGCNDLDTGSGTTWCWTQKQNCDINEECTISGLNIFCQPIGGECSETDSGLDYENYGVLTKGGTTFVDDCIDGYNLKEVYFKSDYPIGISEYD